MAFTVGGGTGSPIVLKQRTRFDAVLKSSLTNNDAYTTLMSSDKMPKKDNRNTKLAIVAGILVLGIFASVAVGSQILNASAQTSSSNTQTPVTSGDDINCAEETSAVHCVDGQKLAYPTVGSNSSGKHFSNDNTTATVSTNGVAATKVKPDRVAITAGVETNTTATASEAASANAEIMADVVAALKELGLADEQISTTNYSIYPVYAYKQDNRTATSAMPCIDIYPPPPECQVSQEIVGYKAANSVTVELDVDGEVEAGSVIDAAVEADANTVNGVSFFVSEEMQHEVRDSLIEDAIANARHRADVAAGAVGLQVSGVRSIDLSDVQFPIYARGADSTLTSATEFLPGQQEVTTSVSITFYMSTGGNASASTTGSSQNEEDGSEAAVAAAREFILSKLPSLGIQIDNELDLHSDMVVHVSDREYHVDYSVLDTNDDSHDGHIEVLDGKVTVATLDGKSIL